VPLLVGSPMQSAMDRIVLVDCSEKVQLARLLQRDLETPDQAQRMIDAQASRDQRLAIADDVVSSDTSLAETRQQVETLHRRYLEFAAGKTD